MNKIAIISLIIIGVCMEGNAQMDISTLSQKFESYQSARGKTKIHLILNQDKFSPGDTVWFKAYFLKEDMTAVAGRQLIDINLVDFEGKSKLHFLINVTEGTGQNQFIIPRTLVAGFYLVTAHSSWMKNFHPLSLFTKSIQVVTDKTIVEKEATRIFPVAEGGHLISNISNKVSVMTNRINAPIQIIDAAGKETGRAITDYNGMASIHFVPAKETSYFVKIEGDTTRAILSAVEKEGYSIFLTPVKTNDEHVKILLTASPGSSSQEELTFIVSARGKIAYVTSSIPHANEKTELKLPKEKLPAGAVHLSVITRAGNSIAHRDFYIPDENRIHVKIETLKNKFQTREKVQLEVSVSDRNGHPVVGEFAVRVLNAALFDTAKNNSFNEKMRLSNEEEFNIDPSDTSTSWISSLDNYLICNTATLPWKGIIQGNFAKPAFPFTTAIQKNGIAYIGDNHEPVPDFTQVMFYLQKNSKHYQVVVQEKGLISLAIPDIYGQDEFFYLAEAKGEKIPNLKIEWEDTSIQLPRSQHSSETKNTDAYAASFTKRNLIDQSYSVYSPSQETPGTIAANYFEDEIDGADISINVQDYITFSSMEELVKEISSSLYHRKKGNSGSVRIKLIPPMIATEDPLYIIDGIATKSTDFFLSLNPSDLLTLKIVKSPKKLLPLGLMGKNGIVIIQTKKGDTRQSVDASMLIEGINKALHFSNHNYSGDTYKQKPDFRSTIYWNPFIKTDSNGKATLEFYTSDDTGKLNIILDGLSKDGKSFSAFKNIEVTLRAEGN